MGIIIEDTYTLENPTNGTYNIPLVFSGINTACLVAAVCIRDGDILIDTPMYGSYPLTNIAYSDSRPTGNDLSYGTKMFLRICGNVSGTHYVTMVISEYAKYNLTIVAMALSNVNQLNPLRESISNPVPIGGTRGNISVTFSDADSSGAIFTAQACKQGGSIPTNYSALANYSYSRLITKRESGIAKTESIVFTADSSFGNSVSAISISPAFNNSQAVWF